MQSKSILGAIYFSQFRVPSSHIAAKATSFLPPPLTSRLTGVRLIANTRMAVEDSSSKDSTASSMRVVSYNTLSSKLADPKFHTKCEEKNLRATSRLPRILSKLQGEIDQGDENGEPVIFCLQEVSHDWATSLHIFFAERGYHFITALYGRKFNGYMGIAIAFPTKQFELLKVDLVRLSDTRPGGWPYPPKDQPGILRRIINPLIISFKAVYSLAIAGQNKNDDPWSYSQYRNNQFIAVELKRRGASGGSSPFFVGNYHMPCAFKMPSVMNIHVDLVGSRIQKLAGEDREYILAGDFNITPDSTQYKLLRTGVIDKEDSSYPPQKYDEVWNSSVKGMRSAYFEHNGSEPEFTNAAHNGALDSESFIDTLDYIFLSHEWKVKDVRSLPKKEGLHGVFPNSEEPSDHLMIAASLEM